MRTKRRSEPLSKRSRKQSTDRLSSTGKRLLAAIAELQDHFSGKTALPMYTYNVPERIDVSAIRAAMSMSQTEFAATFAINSRTLQDWEQGRREPDATVRAYLIVIARDPTAVRRALGM